MIFDCDGEDYDSLGMITIDVPIKKTPLIFLTKDYKSAFIVDRHMAKVAIRSLEQQEAAALQLLIKSVELARFISVSAKRP